MPLYPATHALVGAYFMAVLGFYAESLASLQQIKLPELHGSPDQRTELEVTWFKKLKEFIREFCTTSPNGSKTMVADLKSSN